MCVCVYVCVKKFGLSKLANMLWEEMIALAVGRKNAQTLMIDDKILYKWYFIKAQQMGLSLCFY